MSRVLLIAADKSLPLCDKKEERTVVSRFGGKEYRITCLSGFCVNEHAYYRPAVEALGYAIKPFRYELELEEHETDLKNLLDYLREHFHQGETVELWNLWVGDDQDNKPIRYAGDLTDFHMDTLKQFLKPMLDNGVIGQCRMTVTV